MDKAKSDAIDQTMIVLLQEGYSLDIGMPCWAIVELLNRKDHQLSPNDIVGKSRKFRENNMLSEYRSMAGYHFSWGTLSERTLVDEDDQTTSYQFEFCLKELLLEFPNAGMLEDLIFFLYQSHPLYSNNFQCGEAQGEWFTLSFTAQGDEKLKLLRHWLSDAFIPTILPDLIHRSLSTIRAKKEAHFQRTRSNCIAELLVERGRYQLCDSCTATRTKY